jgi:hypothetical protein
MTSGNYITEVIPYYDYAASVYQPMYAACEAAADKLLSGIVGNQDLTDVQKALLIHDRLAVWCEYDYARLLDDTLTDETYTMYGALVNRYTVCQGYAETYLFLLRVVGIESELCSSDALNHAWNIVKIDGKFYHVDVTWDDTGGTDDFFVRPRGEFEESHKAGDEYPDDFFTKVCPVSKEEYRTDPEAICALITGHAQEFAKLFAA